MGHLYRALALVDALDSAGASALICINDDPASVGVLRARNRRYQVVSLDADTDWETELIRDRGIRVWVNDRRDTQDAHARRVLAAGARLASFDDRGPGGALADLNIVPLPGSDPRPPPGRRVLTGLEYLVLDPSIAQYRRLRRQARSLVVSMGGSDTHGLTIDVIRALRKRQLRATIVLGPGFRHDAEFAQEAESSFEVRREVRSLCAEFARHDLAITAGGITLCEAIAAGLPCVTVAAEPWEEHHCALLCRAGGSVHAGYRHNADYTVLDRPLDIEAMSAAALKTMPLDGSSRVASELLAL